MAATTATLTPSQGAANFMMPNFNLANLGAMRNMEARPVSAPGMWGGQQAPVAGPYPVSPIATPHPAGPNLGMLGALGGQPQQPMPVQQPIQAMPHPVAPMMPQGGMPYGMPYGGFHMGFPQAGPQQAYGGGNFGGGMGGMNLQNLMAMSQMRQGGGY